MLARATRFPAHREARQVSVLAASMAGNVLIGIATSVVNARLLGPDDYGKYRLLITLFTFTAAITTLGYYNSIGRLFACEFEPRRNAGLAGAGVLIVGVASLILTVFFFAFSFFADELFHSHISRCLRLAAPFAGVFSLYLYLESALQGDNRIYSLAVSRFVPKLLYLSSVLPIALIFGLGLEAAILLVVGTQGLVCVIQLIKTRPAFHDLAFHWMRIRRENSTYGFPVYVGYIASVATADLFGLVTGYLVGVEALGYYSLALTISMPLGFVGSVFGTTYFKRFTAMDSIPRKVLLATLVLGAASFLAFVLMVRPVVVLLYSREYEATVPLAYILAAGFALHGLADFFNRFLGAHGRGRELRNSAFVLGGTLLGLGLLLTDRIGVVGAAMANALGSLVYLATMIFFYLRMQARRSATRETNRGPLDG